LPANISNKFPESKTILRANQHNAAPAAGRRAGSLALQTSAPAWPTTLHSFITVGRRSGRPAALNHLAPTCAPAVSRCLAAAASGRSRFGLADRPARFEWEAAAGGAVRARLTRRASARACPTAASPALVPGPPGPRRLERRQSRSNPIFRRRLSLLISRIPLSWCASRKPDERKKKTKYFPPATHARMCAVTVVLCARSPAPHTGRPPLAPPPTHKHNCRPHNHTLRLITQAGVGNSLGGLNDRAGRIGAAAADSSSASPAMRRRDGPDSCARPECLAPAAQQVLPPPTGGRQQSISAESEASSGEAVATSGRCERRRRTGRFARAGHGRRR
jgi:hypothetical protein